jgi:hypothetical protein
VSTITSARLGPGENRAGKALKSRRKVTAAGKRSEADTADAGYVRGRAGFALQIHYSIAARICSSGIVANVVA